MLAASSRASEYAVEVVRSASADCGELSATGEASMTVLDLIRRYDKPDNRLCKAGCFRLCVAAASKSGKCGC